MQNWVKLGKIFEVDKNTDWMYSYSSVPFAEYIGDDLFKIYFSCSQIKQFKLMYFACIVTNSYE